MRLIDVDAITEEDKAKHGFKNDYELYNFLKSQPEVDAVKVVRCKDCFYYEKYPAGDETIMVCGRTYAKALDGDYCSRGITTLRKA